MRAIAWAFLLAVCCGCGQSKDPRVALDEMEAQELRPIQDAAKPLIAAIESYHATTGRYPVPALPHNRIEGLEGRLPAPGVSGYSPFQYWEPRQGTPQRYLLETCAVDPGEGILLSREMMKCLSFYGVGTGGLPGVCPPESEGLPGVQRAVGDWCLSYQEAPPA